MNEQAELMRETVKEFADKNIKDIAVKIEREGMNKTLRDAIIKQGFIGSTLPSTMGGADLDSLSHRLMLFELARVSPSVALYVYFNNDIILNVLSAKNKVDEIKYILSGEHNYGIYWPSLMEGSMNDEDDNILARVVGRNSTHVLDLEKDGKLFSTSGKAENVDDFKPLGLRGLGICNFVVDKKEEMGNVETLEDLLIRSSSDIAAIFLGLSEGAIEKAIEYTTVRKTFNESLKNYEPVAFRMAELKSELEIMKDALFTEEADEIKMLMLKNVSASFAKRTTKFSLQFHGGYGYLEDFGMEKFYRDSVALNAIIYRPIKDKSFLATKIYSSRSGYL
ncbi:MAG: acyl-CoA dehydrogenase family protein [Cuniculiplasma sp.]